MFKNGTGQLIEVHHSVLRWSGIFISASGHVSFSWTPSLLPFPLHGTLFLWSLQVTHGTNLIPPVLARVLVVRISDNSWFHFYALWCWSFIFASCCIGIVQSVLGAKTSCTFCHCYNSRLRKGFCFSSLCLSFRRCLPLQLRLCISMCLRFVLEADCILLDHVRKTVSNTRLVSQISCDVC